MSKPRYRVLTSGWIRHDGGDMPGVITGADRVNIVVKAGNAAFIQGLPAGSHQWRHTGFSKDIIAWRPA